LAKELYHKPSDFSSLIDKSGKGRWLKPEPGVENRLRDLVQLNLVASSHKIDTLKASSVASTELVNTPKAIGATVAIVIN